MDYKPGGEVEAFRDLRFTGPAPVQHPACFQQAGPRSPVDGPVDTSASEECRVGGVDDGIGFLHGDITGCDRYPAGGHNSHQERMGISAVLRFG